MPARTEPLVPIAAVLVSFVVFFGKACSTGEPDFSSPEEFANRYARAYCSCAPNQKKCRKILQSIVLSDLSQEECFDVDPLAADLCVAAAKAHADALGWCDTNAALAANAEGLFGMAEQCPGLCGEDTGQ